MFHIGTAETSPATRAIVAGVAATVSTESKKTGINPQIKIIKSTTDCGIYKLWVKRAPRIHRPPEAEAGNSRNSVATLELPSSASGSL